MAIFRFLGCKKLNYLLRLSSVVFLFVLVSFAGRCGADDDAALPGDSSVSRDVSTVTPRDEGADKTAYGWLSLWGVPARDALLLGMWSLHTSPHRHERNPTQNLIGLQYQGYFASALKNSYYKQSYFAGVTRTIYLKRLAQDFSFDITYKAGLITGYGEHYPNLGGISPFVLPTFGLSYKMLGMDFAIYPSAYPVFSVNFRVNIDKLTGHK
jgi:hypothetical protein